jgi:hypothetical protein
MEIRTDQTVNLMKHNAGSRGWPKGVVLLLFVESPLEEGGDGRTDSFKLAMTEDEAEKVVSSIQRVLKNIRSK